MPVPAFSRQTALSPEDDEKPFAMIGTAALPYLQRFGPRNWFVFSVLQLRSDTAGLTIVSLPELQRDCGGMNRATLQSAINDLCTLRVGGRRLLRKIPCIKFGKNRYVLFPDRAEAPLADIPEDAPEALENATQRPKRGRKPSPRKITPDLFTPPLTAPLAAPVIVPADIVDTMSTLPSSPSPTALESVEESLEQIIPSGWAYEEEETSEAPPPLPTPATGRRRASSAASNGMGNDASRSKDSSLNNMLLTPPQVAQKTDYLAPSQVAQTIDYTIENLGRRENKRERTHSDPAGRNPETVIKPSPPAASNPAPMTTPGTPVTARKAPARNTTAPASAADCTALFIELYTARYDRKPVGNMAALGARLKTALTGGTSIADIVAAVRYYFREDHPNAPHYARREHASNWFIMKFAEIVGYATGRVEAVRAFQAEAAGRRQTAAIREQNKQALSEGGDILPPALRALCADDDGETPLDPYAHLYANPEDDEAPPPVAGSLYKIS